MMNDIPAQPDEGFLPTPAIPSQDDQPAHPEEGFLPTPAIPSQDDQPAHTEEGFLPTPTLPSQPPVSVRPLCTPGYSLGVVRNGQTFTDLLLENNVSYAALRAANPTLPTTRLTPGTHYCIPPSGTRRLCPSGSSGSYVMGQYEDLNTLSELFGYAPGLFLTTNPQLAPGDFTAGRVICVP